MLNVFIKPNEQSGACSDSAMARKQKEEIEMLFRQYYSQMIRLARRLLYDDEESRDVVSEVFITLINTDILSKNMEDYLIASILC